MVLCVTSPVSLLNQGDKGYTNTRAHTVHTLPRVHASSNFLVHLRSSSIERQTRIALCFVMVSLLA